MGRKLFHCSIIIIIIYYYIYHNKRRLPYGSILSVNYPATLLHTGVRCASACVVNVLKRVYHKTARNAPKAPVYILLDAGNVNGFSSYC